MLLASRQIADSVNDAFAWITGISLVFLVGITVAMFYFIIRYSRKRHPKAADISGNTKLEITWIVIPTIIVMFMFWLGFRSFLIMRTTPEDAMEVVVEARQWAWTFTYPDTGVTSNELYVPVNQPIKLLLTVPEDDVVHSFYVPDFRVKEDCVPGYTNHMWLEADKVGSYNIFCAEFCGRDHARMITLMHALEPEAFERWLDDRLADRYRPVTVADALDAESEAILAGAGATRYGVYCASCHGPEGRGGLVEGARNFHSTDGWKKGAKLTDIFRTLTEGLEGTQMRAFDNLPPWERLALAHYVRGFIDGGPPETTRADMEALIAEYKLDEKVEVTRSFPIEDAMRARAEEAAEDEENPR